MTGWRFILFKPDDRSGSPPPGAVLMENPRACPEYEINCQRKMMVQCLSF
ncbi:hypothetical protein HMPREF3038_00470 [Akkermansia sp. KLE1797]|nr:hypothetical protein HMPREF3038_00470 [Akkermansia sp. KLE1797]KXU55612.1 hypothetical protein HMPREF3039_00169 [Akkermansia sp. KLE1798]KZA05456.1 hypothetical protein HMPREF1326_00863 [Akkermansia sp. KLE1605]